MDFYHVLNRGVDKRDIFLDSSDYARFIHDLFEFNDIQPVSSNYSRTVSNRVMKDVGRPSLQLLQKRELLVHIHAFCLMPNHYHLLLSPAVENGIPLFMKKLNGGYAKYFNERYKRDGALFQGKYKSVHVEQERHFMYLPFYIHFNPLDLKMKEWREAKLKNIDTAFAYLEKYRWSSHLDYMGIKNFPSVTKREFLLEYFNGQQGYKQMVRQTLKSFSLEEIGNLTLE